MQKKVAFSTLGCKVNQYDTQAMLEFFLASGYKLVDDYQDANVYVVNTCTVTQAGEKKSLQLIRRCRRNNPDAHVIVTGCLAQRRSNALSNTGARLIIGTQRRSEVVELLEQAISDNSQIIAVEDLVNTPFETLNITSHEGHTRAIMKIQEGCNYKCTYCIIPSVRGPIRSRSLEDIKKEATALAQAGYTEIILTGIHLTSYGKDYTEKIQLIDAIETVCDIEGIERVRIGSLEPSIITEEFVKRLSLKHKVCPQFHLALQSGCDSVLRRMKRRYTTSTFTKATNIIRDYYPKAAFTTDLIVGFPGETDEEFDETLEFIKKIKFSKIHVFPYSIREGTPAATMPNQLSKSIKHERVRKVIAVEATLSETYRNSFINTESEVLVEELNHDGLFVGYTPTYIPVIIDDGAVGQIVKVSLTGLTEEGFIGQVVSKTIQLEISNKFLEV